MEIIYYNKIEKLEKFNRNLKIDLKNCHCLYFGNENEYANTLPNDLTINVSFPTDFVVDKEEFKIQYLNLIDNLTSTFSNKYWWATETVPKFRSQLLFFLHKFQIVLSLVKKYNPEKLIIVDKEIIFERLLFHYSKDNNIKFISSLMNVRKQLYIINIICQFYIKMIRSFIGLVYKILIRTL